MSRRLRQLMQTELDRAESYQEWKAFALRKDKLDAVDVWKLKDRTTLYDYAAIRRRVDTYRELRAQSDAPGLLFALNEGIHGNMGGMGEARLYERATFGTKQLISDYVEEVVAALDYLASDKVDAISLEQKLEFFNRAGHCYGRSALMLSGSGSLFYFHLGVVKALWEENLLPSVVSGASGGAIVAAIVGCHSHGDLARIFKPELLRMEVEHEESLSNRRGINRFTRLSADAVSKFFERLIPDLTFQEASKLTGIHISVSVAPAGKHQKSRLLNDIASPNVTIREALMASSALPGFYPAVTLAAKDEEGHRKPYLPSHKWIDGSVSDDLPITRVMRLYGVNHSIVSQTNPVALPFIGESSPSSRLGLVKQTVRSTSKEWALLAARLIDPRTKSNGGLGRLLTLGSSILAQTYTGDINILPPRRMQNPAYLLVNRSSDEIFELIRLGERAAWPELERIRIQTSISRRLDQIIGELEAARIEKTTRRQAPGRRLTTKRRKQVRRRAG